MKYFLLWLWKLDTRLLEWLLGLELLRRGTLWATGAAPMISPSYDPMVKVMPAVGWGLVFLTIGLVQLSGIAINGNWRRSPYLRQFALLFSVMAYTLLAHSFLSGSNPGAALQGSTQQFLNAATCLWCLFNISAKRPVYA